MILSLDLEKAIEKMNQYPAGGARSEYVRSLAEHYNVSVSTIYRWHRDNAPASERKARADKGTRTLSTEQTEDLAGLIFASKRQSNKVLMSAKTAREIADDNSFGLPDVSVSTINRRLREVSLSKKKMKAPSPSIRLITQHPNQLWEFDVSNCVQYFLDDKGLGERDVEMELYKNKIKNFKSIKKELLRYLIVDHTSGAFWLHYFYTSGETAMNAAEFFLSAFKEKNNKSYRFHGVPFCLYVDRGSAVKSAMIRGLLEKLHIKCLTHLPGNPRAKGMVEGLHDYVERNFESRLTFHGPRDLSQLNAWAVDWAVETNAVEIYRDTAPRSQLWSYITKDQLRLCPPEDVFRRLLASKAEERTVTNNLFIQYDGNFYRVPDANLSGERVAVSYSPYEYPNIEVAHPALEHPLCLSPCQQADKFGRITDGGVVFQLDDEGNPTYKRPKDTQTQKGLKRVEKNLEAYGLKFRGTGDKRRAMAPAPGDENLVVFGHQADKTAHIAYLDRPGTVLPVGKEVEVRDLATIKAVKIIVERLGRSLKVSENEWIQKTYGATVPENKIDAIVAALGGQQSGGSIRRANEG